MEPSNQSPKGEVFSFEQQVEALEREVGALRGYVRGGALRRRLYSGPVVRAAAALTAAALVLVIGLNLAPAAPYTCLDDLPHCFAANTPAKASQVNDNFNYIAEWIRSKVGGFAIDGISIPKMTTDERLAVVGPEEGVKVYDTDAHVEMFYNGARWAEVGGDPIGTIKAWHRDMADVPSLPWGWVECDGTTLEDEESPLDGSEIPNLNGDRKFLRGGDSSGTNQEATAVIEDTNNNTVYRPYVLNSDGPLANPNAMYYHDWGGQDGNYSDIDLQKVRPVNMSVVWIIRVK